MGQDQSQGQGNAASPAASSTVVVPPLQGLRTVLLVGFAGIFALGVLYPFLGILLSPLLAALAMSFSSVTVIANANRLKLWKPRTAGALR